jgi:hypothetical protein
MKKGFAVLTVCCSFMMLQVPYGAETAQAAQTVQTDQTAETIPPYVEVPNAGEYKMGGDNLAVEHDGKQQAGTDFYIRIENAQRGSSPGSSGNDGNGGSSASSSEPQSITYANSPMGNNELEEMEMLEQDGKLPKTGDYGPDKIVLFELALIFGAGYLICDQYEKTHEKY